MEELLRHKQRVEKAYSNVKVPTRGVLLAELFSEEVKEAAKAAGFWVGFPNGSCYVFEE